MADVHPATPLGSPSASGPAQPEAATPLAPELTVTVGTGWTYIGNGEALRLRSITGGCAVIEIARADRAFPQGDGEARDA